MQSVSGVIKQVNGFIIRTSTPFVISLIYFLLVDVGYHCGRIFYDRRDILTSLVSFIVEVPLPIQSFYFDLSIFRLLLTDLMPKYSVI